MTAEPRERLASLDALRGLAVLGILAVNASLFAVPMYQAWYPSHWPFPVDQTSTVIWAVVQVLFTGKFITLFSMLFGVSVWLVGGERGDPVRTPRLYRRLGWLAVFGLLHGLFVWWGDILLIYAVAGLLIAPMRSWPANRLLLAGGSGYLILSALDAGHGILNPDYDIQTWNLVLTHQAGYRDGFLGSLQANLADWAVLTRSSGVLNVISAALLMQVGLGLYKTGILKAEAPARLYGLLIAAGALGVAAMAALTVHEMRAEFDVPSMALSAGLLHLIAPLITLGYIGAMMLAVRRRAAMARLLAQVGRMAFTNYLTQSVVMTSLFYGGRGPGLFAEVDRPRLALIVAGVWLGQIIVSHLWLRWFAMGPAEWVWRRLTYATPVAFRRTPS